MTEEEPLMVKGVTTIQLIWLQSIKEMVGDSVFFKELWEKL